MESIQTLTLVVAVLSLCASVVMIARVLWRHRVSLRTGTDPLQPHRFTRRRVTMGVLLAVVAMMLFIGVVVLGDYFIGNPLAFTWFWLAVLAILVWLLALAVFDFFAVLHARIDFRRLKGPPRGE